MGIHLCHRSNQPSQDCGSLRSTVWQQQSRPRTVAHSDFRPRSGLLLYRLLHYTEWGLLQQQTDHVPRRGRETSSKAAVAERSASMAGLDSAGGWNAAIPQAPLRHGERTLPSRDNIVDWSVRFRLFLFKDCTSGMHVIFPQFFNNERTPGHGVRVRTKGAAQHETRALHGTGWPDVEMTIISALLSRTFQPQFQLRDLLLTKARESETYCMVSVLPHFAA